MKIALLRFFARRPLTLLAIGAASVLGTAAAIGAAVLGPCDARETVDPGEPVAPQDNPRKILSRGWFDRWPEKRKDNIHFFYFGGGGVGLHEEGSAYRYTADWFDLERQNNKLSIKFLQDGKTTETTFTITPCDEKPPFDLCLDLADSPRGPKRYYGFDDSEDEAANLPAWSAERLRAARSASR
jgi:hypothetical protein